MKKALLLTKNFKTNLSERWLFNDLADSLIDREYDVYVVNLDFKSCFDKSLYETESGIRIFNIRFLKKTFPRISDVIRLKNLPPINSFSIVFSHSIVFLHLPLILGKRFSKIKERYVFLWDFFPVHHFQIKKIRFSWLLPFFKSLESFALSRFSQILFMSKSGIDFFKAYHYRLYNTSDIKLSVLPLWTRSIDLNAARSLLHSLMDSKSSELENKAEDYTKNIKLIFGGQLSKGRGLGWLIDAVNKSNLINVELDIYGDGELRDILLEQIYDIGSDRIRYKGSLSRDDYRAILSNYDCGVIITESQVISPSFPSKIVDYSLSGLPCICGVEPASDLGKIVIENNIGFNFDLSDLKSFEAALLQAYEQKYNGSLNEKVKCSLSYGLEHFDLDKSLDRLNV